LKSKKFDFLFYINIFKLNILNNFIKMQVLDNTLVEKSFTELLNSLSPKEKIVIRNRV
jgi:hypothetical protein